VNLQIDNFACVSYTKKLYGSWVGAYGLGIKQFTDDIFECKEARRGRCHGNHILAQISKMTQKMAITSTVCNTIFGFQIEFQVSAKSFVALPYTIGTTFDRRSLI